ncbi:MAG: tyrosine-type recombinase/integrase [Oscillospiraceae bacterium]|nr:tyrosine-type recombinase/integrase [Oscillospiraceae bacterium]
MEKSKADYFEQEEVNAILQEAEHESLKWRTLLHLLLVTDGRRGEVLGLTWENMDFTFNRIHIMQCVYHAS